jgi:sec-independent protein translocase protein TatA
MGLGGISMSELLIILVIVLLVFGTKKLSSLGGDLGGAIKNFKKAMSDEESIKANADAAGETKRVTETEKVETPAETVKSETKQS